jgi:hypothetical protein
MPAVLLCHIPSYAGPPTPYISDDGQRQLVPIATMTEHWDTRNGIACSRTQFALRPAWALTVHKSQGLTLSKVRVRLGDSDFSYGLSYVALSRATGGAALQLETLLAPTRLTDKTGSRGSKVLAAMLADAGLRATHGLRPLPPPPMEVDLFYGGAS